MMINTDKPLIVVDLETYDLSGSLVWCVGLVTADDAWSVEWDASTTPAYLNDLLPDYTPVIHNAKFDVRVLRQHGVTVNEFWDTALMSYVWNPRREAGHSLGSWGRELGYTKIDYRQACIAAGLLDAKSPKGSEHHLPYDDIKRDYCIRDCQVAWKLWAHLHPKLVSDPRALKLLTDIELPMVNCLIEMESTGFYIDKSASAEMVDVLATACDKLADEMAVLVPFVPGKEIIYKAGVYKEKIGEEVTEFPDDEKYLKRYGKVKTKTTAIQRLHYSRCELVDFNPNSNTQISDALIRMYGWEPEKFTPAGAPKTDADTLEGLEYPLAKLLCEYSVVNKMHGMVTGYMEYLGTGRRLHGEFNQMVTKTGRLSSSNPNVQNIPTNGIWGEKMRSLFVSPGAGWKMVGCDLSNIEGRVLAHYLSLVCGEHRMTETFAAGVDFHQKNADAWNISRKEAKTGLYGLLYGCGINKLGGGDKAKGQAIMNSIYDGMPAIKQLKELVWKRCESNGGVVYDAFGRRLYYPEITMDGARAAAKVVLAQQKGTTKTLNQLAKGFVAQAQRRVFNALLQGTAASVLKVITLNVQPLLAEYSAYMVASIHDELLFYVPEEHAEAFAAILSREFSKPLLSNCPILGEAKVGDSWLQIH